MQYIDLIFSSSVKYYGVDWFGSTMFCLYAWTVARNPSKAQWYAVSGSLTNLVFAFMVFSVANLLSSAVFFALYFRAAILLGRGYGENH